MLGTRSARGGGAPLANKLSFEAAWEEEWSAGPWEDAQRDGELCALRPLGEGDAGRVHAWRKHARDGTLPPILTTYSVMIGKCIVLDGHVRLAAALEEGVKPPVLSIWPVRKVVTGVAPEDRERTWNQLDPDALPPEKRVDAQNRVLVAAFTDRVSYEQRPVGWPLRGGVEEWNAEFEAACTRSSAPRARAGARASRGRK